LDRQRRSPVFNGMGLLGHRARGQWSAVIAFAIAVVKTLLVATFFMHLLYEKQKVVWI
jgi:caa(3)-type oxidase subunit IV